MLDPELLRRPPERPVAGTVFVAPRRKSEVLGSGSLRRGKPKPKLRSLKGSLLVLIVVFALAGACSSTATAGPWCGTVATRGDRPAVVGGLDIHVIYAVPADGVDASAAWAPRISADLDSIDAWWRANDPTRTPRFDLAAFSCGPQVDLTFARLALSSDELAAADGKDGRDRLMIEDPRVDTWVPESKVLVYYDGPVNDADVCGTGGGVSEGAGHAVVYLAACHDQLTALTAAHELIHAGGIALDLPPGGPPHHCPGDIAHVCDSVLDILYPSSRGLPLSSLVLDVNRDDYYGHGGAWFDIRASGWLQWLDAQSPLDVVVRGKGTVASGGRGIDCPAACRLEFNTNERIFLGATPGPGQRFVRWSGACSSTGPENCDFRLTGPRSVTALFAPARFRLSVAVRGHGSVRGARIACPSRCSAEVISFKRVVLRAVPARGWKLKAWGGACHGSWRTCSLPMSRATSARATFGRA
jgi:hypothetical protein